jgi:hypothetical protein
MAEPALRMKLQCDSNSREGRTSADGVHGTRLQVEQHSARHVAAARRFVVVHVDALQLHVGVAVVRARGVHTVFIRDDFPKLGADLVATLAALQVNCTRKHHRTDRIRPRTNGNMSGNIKLATMPTTTESRV